MSSIVNVHDAPYNAVGDGITDDTDAIQAAMNSGQQVYVPKIYKITRDITCSKSLHISGDNMHVSKFIMSGESRFIFYGGDASDYYNTTQLRLENMSFVTDSVTNKIVVEARWVGGNGNTSTTAIIRDVSISGMNPSCGFGNALYLFNATNAVVDHLHIVGCRDDRYRSSYGIRIEGDAHYEGNGIVGGAPVDMYFNRCSIYFCVIAFNVYGWIEGVHLEQNTIVACREGVNAVASPWGRPYLNIVNNHFNTSRYGVVMTDYVQSSIINNLFYAQMGNDGTDTNYVGVHIGLNAPVDGSNRVSDNTFFGIIHIPKYAIVFDGGSNHDSIVSNNIIHAHNIGIWLKQPTRTITIQNNNKFINCQETIRNDSGQNTNTYSIMNPNEGQWVDNDGLTHKFGNSVISVDTNGNGWIPFTNPYKNQILNVIISDGDNDAIHGLLQSVDHSMCSQNGIAIKIRPNPGPMLTRVFWNTIGW